MSDFRSFSRDFVEQFINIYREEERLWKTTLKEYSDKGKRNAAYDRLILLSNLGVTKRSKLLYSDLFIRK